MSKKLKENYSDELDILSATWILASNDENPIITYEGIKYRLGLPDDYDVKGVVRSRPELFRRGIPEGRLEKWKQDLLLGKHVPSWIRESESTEQRNARINALTAEDGFRSQFRAGEKAPRSPIEIID
jgi:hypothetical protein